MSMYSPASMVISPPYEGCPILTIVQGVKVVTCVFQQAGVVKVVRLAFELY